MGKKNKGKGKPKADAASTSIAGHPIGKHCHSEISGQHLIRPANQQKSVHEILNTNEYLEHFHAWMDVEKTGVADTLEVGIESSPPVQGSTINVEEFVDKGGCVIYKPIPEHLKGTGTTTAQALAHRKIVSSPDFVKYIEPAKPPEPESRIQGLEKAMGEILIKMETMSGRIRTLEQGNIDDLKDENKAVKAALATLGKKVKKLGGQVEALMLVVHPFRLVVIRKLLEKFRKKVCAECKEMNLAVPSDWNRIAIGDTMAGERCRDVIGVSQEAFFFSRFASESLQTQAGEVLHTLEGDQWDKVVYAGNILSASIDIRPSLFQNLRVCLWEQCRARRLGSRG
ncbi:hypothetical protein O6H91_01G018800 [Diphasiastrum complanatum]|uniref:Uncharacterized protein n=1 Tax=Diphasiastrum complanatum TaxID=34168 RepID=A0ACC2ENV6_DIPCM|nr:hypothetical protein O6H91_01G018800 [Diphasiastrum complanatum]